MNGGAESFERWAWRVGADKHLDFTARAVLACLATFANRKRGGWAWPSADTLADATGLTARAVRAALGRIEAAGILEVDRRPGHATRWGFPIAGDPVDNQGGERRSGVNVVPKGVNVVQGTPEPGSPVSIKEALRSKGGPPRNEAEGGAMPVDKDEDEDRTSAAARAEHRRRVAELRTHVGDGTPPPAPDPDPDPAEAERRAEHARRFAELRDTLPPRYRGRQA